MLNYLKKFAVDIFPSVAATVIGAYIVNHYIVTKPNTDAPAATASTANPKGDGKTEAKSDAKPAESTASVSNLPAAGVKARGISEKAIMEKTAAERPAVVEKTQEKTEAKADVKTEAKPDAKPDTKAADSKSADTRSADTKSDVKSADTPADADQRRHAAAPREKEKIRVVLPSPIAVNPSAAPVAAAAPAAPVETAVAAPDERRDANDLARAAIERLRANGEASPRAAETVRAPEAPRAANAPAVVSAPAAANAPVVANAPAVNAPALRPLPPPIMISGQPAGEPYGQASSQARPPYAEANPNRPTPPADIPLSRPLDLRAEAAEPSVRERATAAAEDALSTAKSIFHAVLPK
jgi:hypothetical protein